jgi:23S rRNA pseudouridine2605 synthase
MTAELPNDPISELDDEPTSSRSSSTTPRRSRMSHAEAAKASANDEPIDDDIDNFNDEEMSDEEIPYNDDEFPAGDLPDESELLNLDEPDDEPEPVSRPVKKGDSDKKSPRGKKRQAAVDLDLDEAAVVTERLQKVLASAGLASRRHCEEYILDGRVTVDGKTVTALGLKVDPDTQKVCVDGERIKIERKRHFLIHKPPGVHCTNADPMGRTRVIDLLPTTQGRLFTVGRLDEGSEGLLLVTNDGELAHRLAHPKFQVERLYRCLVAGTPSDEVLRQLRSGMYFTEGKFRVRDIRRVKTNGKSTVVEVILTEGQNREVRRLFARVGHKVMRLKRIGFGPLRLGELPIGAYRPLTPVELKVLVNFAATPATRRTASRARPIRNASASARSTKPATRGHATRGPAARGPKAAAKRSHKPGKRPPRNR